MPDLWWALLKFSYKISKNPLRGLIGMQKPIEFQLPYYTNILGLLEFAQRIIFTFNYRISYLDAKHHPTYDDARKQFLDMILSDHVS